MAVGSLPFTFSINLSEDARVKTLAFWTSVMLVFATPVLRAQQAAHDDLYRTVAGLDTAFFDAFNHCGAPGQLEKHASLMDPNVEFYHDNGGVSWTRKDYIDKTRQNVCGHFRRKLVPGTMAVYPIKDFGAIEEGSQNFCDIKSDTCFGEAKFMVIWRRTAEGWQATRIFSYGHRAIDSGSDRR